MERGLLHALNALRSKRRAAFLVTALATGQSRLVPEEAIGADPLAETMAGALRSGRSQILTTEAGELFLSVEIPPPRLVVIGAVHIAQALVRVAAVAEMDVIVIDPRTAFATPERFAGVRLIADWPETVLNAVGLDAYTALAALTHDPKIDDFALEEALRRGCFYVGALGSRKTHGKRCERLAARGVPAADLARIKAPIGLDIAAAAPGEIAVAIMAEIIATWRGRDLTLAPGTVR